MAAAAVKVWTGTGQAVSVWSLNTPAGLLTQSQGVQQLRKLRSLGMGQWSWATVCHYVPNKTLARCLTALLLEKRKLSSQRPRLTGCLC